MKRCFKCSRKKNLDEFYRHPMTTDGHLGKCKVCARKDAKKNKPIERKCVECGSSFNTNISEINRGGGITCSRPCYYQRFRKIVKREENSPNWKGDKVGKNALHRWVEIHLGKPMKCAKCGNDKKKKYEWANISRKYKRELKDWMRLCTRCHIIYDGSKNFKNYPRLTYKQFLTLNLKD